MANSVIVIALFASILTVEPLGISTSTALAIRFDPQVIAIAYLPIESPTTSADASNATVGEFVVLQHENASRLVEQGSPQTQPQDRLGTLGVCVLAVEQDMIQRGSRLHTPSMAWAFLSSTVHAFAHRWLHHSVNLATQSFNDLVVPSINLALRALDGVWFGYIVTRLAIGLSRVVAVDCFGMVRTAVLNRLWVPITRSKDRYRQKKVQ